MLFFGILFFLLALRYHFNRNRYIISHQDYLKNETHYNKYLKWCEKSGQIPMDKNIFNRDIEKRNNKLKDILK